MSPTSFLERRCNLNRIVTAAAIVLFAMVVPTHVSGQADQGTISGSIDDSNGASIPNASVTLTDVDTGFVYQRKTDATGIYIFSPLKIGNYTVKATAPGFGTSTQEGIHLNAQERLSITLTLKPSEVSESVIVSSAPPLLQVESGSTGQVMSTNTINSVPLNGRNWVFVAQLAAGVAPASGLTRGSGTGDFYANGQLAVQNNFVLDGVDDNANIADLMNASSFIIRPPPDALSEFSVDTANYSAEFGHSAGAVVNASLKSGTNQIHGDLWEYVRNNDFDARDFNALKIPPYHENQFGATLGFPLVYIQSGAFE